MVESFFNFGIGKVLVLWGKNWNEGIMNIVIESNEKWANLEEQLIHYT